MSDRRKAIEAAAEALAKKMIHDRGNPHWHDLRDMYLAGYDACSAENPPLASALSDVALEYDSWCDGDISAETALRNIKHAVEKAWRLSPNPSPSAPETKEGE